MTKAKAKLLAAELIERGFSPIITETSGDYLIGVLFPNGITPAQITAIETTIGGIVGKAKTLEFS